MKAIIHYMGDYEDTLIVEADTFEELKDLALAESDARGWERTKFELRLMDNCTNIEEITPEIIAKLQKWSDEHHLNREIYLYSMVSTARSILADYKRAKFKQYEFLYISNDGYLSVIEGQQKLNDKVEQLEKQLFDILVNIQEFKEEVEE